MLLGLNRKLSSEKRNIHTRHMIICSSAVLIYVLLHLLIGYYGKVHKENVFHNIESNDSWFSFHAPVCNAKDENTPWARNVNLMVTTRLANTSI